MSIKSSFLNILHEKLNDNEVNHYVNEYLVYTYMVINGLVNINHPTYHQIINELTKKDKKFSNVTSRVNTFISEKSGKFPASTLMDALNRLLISMGVDENIITNAVNTFKDEEGKSIEEGLAGALVGGGIGALVGHPIAGAAIGAGGEELLSDSEETKEGTPGALFDEEYDPIYKGGWHQFARPKKQKPEKYTPMGGANLSLNYYEDEENYNAMDDAEDNADWMQKWKDSKRNTFSVKPYSESHKSLTDYLTDLKNDYNSVIK